LKEEGIKALITKEPELVNGTIATRFGVSNSVVGRIRRGMDLETPISEYLTDRDMRNAKCCYSRSTIKHTPVCVKRKPKKEKYAI